MIVYNRLFIKYESELNKFCGNGFRNCWSASKTVIKWFNSAADMKIL